MDEEFKKFIEAHYRKNFKPLVKAYSNIAGGQHEAEDLVQTAYTRAMQYWNSLSSYEDFDKWFSGIFKNSITDLRKDQRLRGMLNIDEVEEPGIYNNIGIAENLRKRVEVLVDAAPVNQRTILNLVLFLGYTPEEASKVVPETANNIRQIVHRFRLKLKEQL